MKRATILLELIGPNVSLQDGEELANMMRLATKMAHLPEGAKLEVGQVTLMNGENNG